MEPGWLSSGIGASLARETAKERRPMTLSLCIWLEEKSPPGTNTSGDSSERFQFKPCYLTYLRFMGVWAWIFALFAISRLCHLAVNPDYSCCPRSVHSRPKPRPSGGCTSEYCAC